ncbi:nickel transport system ATP-binding protein [Paenibacillus catalpae]|uniref:Nickel transport system ATP-binding protein n=1 Tax=Paenibacillus catalpae TaxID=1045775 RepID=A0A1I1VB00_9BACL|nr:ABC transporter ATP-binding protein [Paenibacillus catalpae]SFD80271.1 nickel transport system ATP-binding protein [Paenibacillus catalpae]
MLVVDRVNMSYRKGGMFSREKQQVLKNISFQYEQGECLGIIGESGCGKSTLGRLLMGIEKPERGTILLKGEDIGRKSARKGRISAVFQDYTSSINPYFTVEQAVMESLNMKTSSRKFNQSKVDHLLQHVGLEPSCRYKYPHELSGGQIQRVCIARAIATESPCILLDEAISSLDGSVQMQVLQLLKKLKENDKLGYIFITHDIKAAAFICDRVMIMRSGQVEEIVNIEHLNNVQSPYARKMLQMIIN